MENTGSSAEYRRKRVAFMKKAIIATILAFVLIPIILCIILFIRITKLENKLNGMLVTYSQSATLEAQNSGALDKALDSDGDTDGALNNENVDNHEYDNKDYISDDDKIDAKKVYLTFDDGPSGNTETILDTLKDYNVKATFFVIKKTDDKSVEMYKRIVSEGHTLAMHSTTHRYDQIYNSIDSYMNDVLELQSYLYTVTSKLPTIYRFPGGSSNTVSKVPISECIEFLNANNITYFDWNVASGDATSYAISADAIVNNVITGIEGHDSSVVLMHDANNKTSTVEALPSMIQQLTDMGVKILPISDKTTPVHHKIN